jgi:hypothetical protein
MSGSECRCSPHDEPDQHEKRHREEAEGLPGEPALLACLRDRIHERREAASHEHRTGHVERFDGRIPAFLEQDRREDERRDADGDVDEEDPFPAESVREDAAEQNACGCTKPADGAPDTERDVALPALGERRREDRQRRGRDDRGPEPLEGACGDQ